MSWPLPEDEVSLFFSPQGFMVVAPLPGGRYRIVAPVDEAPEHPSVADVQRVLDERGPLSNAARVGEIGWGSRFHVHHRVAERYRAGRVLIAGDAAHVHSPAGGAQCRSLPQIPQSSTSTSTWSARGVGTGRRSRTSRRSAVSTIAVI